MNRAAFADAVQQRVRAVTQVKSKQLLPTLGSIAQTIEAGSSSWSATRDAAEQLANYLKKREDSNAKATAGDILEMHTTIQNQLGAISKRMYQLTGIIGKYKELLGDWGWK